MTIGLMTKLIVRRKHKQVEMKTHLNEADIRKITCRYDLGEFQDFYLVPQESVQSNYVIGTDTGKYLLKYYEKRSKESVEFERDLIRILKQHNFPCPTHIPDSKGNIINTYKKKPFVIYEFISGEHHTSLSETLQKQLIKQVAELHNITMLHIPLNKVSRLNYSVVTIRKLIYEKLKNNSSFVAKQKQQWVFGVLDELILPTDIPMGVCHADLNFSNVLYEGDKFIALLDFDDSNYTYLLYDLVGLIEQMAWDHKKCDYLDFTAARKVVSEYIRYRSLTINEKKHLFDVYKLSILLDCVWYFNRGNYPDFREKRKINFLNEIGRTRFYSEIFS